MMSVSDPGEVPRPSADAAATPAPTHLELLRPTERLPLGFVTERDTVFLIARERSARWPTDVLRDGTARLHVEGRVVEGAAALVTDPSEKQRVVGLFRSKYGDRRFDRWYANPARVLRIAPGISNGPGDPAALYHRWLAAEFDNVAEEYDRHITGNRVNRLLRDRSLAELRRAFTSAHRLLEIGCGSGMETLPLLEDGHEILCVDISDRMLEVVRSKARAAGLSESLRTARLPASELGRISRDGMLGAFDGAYSTYGAMNCEENLDGVAPALFDLLGPSAPFVAGVYNRWCVFEIMGYGLTGQWSRAFGRVRSPIRVGTSRFCVDVYAYSPREFRHRFEPWFRAERLEAVPVLLPPSDLVEYAERFGRRWSELTRLDRAVGRKWPFRALGDHFLLTFRRRTDRPTVSE